MEYLVGNASSWVLLYSEMKFRGSESNILWERLNMAANLYSAAEFPSHTVFHFLNTDQKPLPLQSYYRATWGTPCFDYVIEYTMFLFL
jgi:hypothetical protein